MITEAGRATAQLRHEVARLTRDAPVPFAFGRWDVAAVRDSVWHCRVTTVDCLDPVAAVREVLPDARSLRVTNIVRYQGQVIKTVCFKLDAAG